MGNMSCSAVGDNSLVAVVDSDPGAAHGASTDSVDDPTLSNSVGESSLTISLGETRSALTVSLGEIRSALTVSSLESSANLLALGMNGLVRALLLLLLLLL